MERIFTKKLRFSMLSQRYLRMKRNLVLVKKLTVSMYT